MIWQLILWAVIFAICIILEIISLGLTTIWFAGGSLVALITALCHGSLPLQILLFAIVSLVLLFTTRPIAKNHFNQKVQKTNVEELIGKQVIVTQTIDNVHNAGQVKVNGLEWSARAKNNDVIPADTIVTIEEVAGVKLIVRADQS